jgi:tetratricopeptide (TPR) repeat protein
MKRRRLAVAANQLGLKAKEKGRLQEAQEHYQRAVALDPTWSVPLYNLGLLFKEQRQWEQSLDYNQRATALDPSSEAAWWNLGIAATALGRWDVARAAWRGFGIKIPEGEGPLDFPCGYGPIRLNADGDGEVVWAHRIDPARAVISNIPLPESRHRWQDVVLNDGAPVGYRTYKGKEIPVLNALQLLEASAFGTFVARVQMPNRRDYLLKLAEIAEKGEGSAEDWSTSVRMICKACSEGRLHETHDTQAAPPEGTHLIALAARDRAHASSILSAWESRMEDVHVEWLDDAVPPGQEADSA